MTTTENETSTPARRVRVTHEPLPGVKPWRAVILVPRFDEANRQTTPGELPVGRFDTQHEAATIGVSALRFVNAGIPWRPVGVEQ